MSTNNDGLILTVRLNCVAPKRGAAVILGASFSVYIGPMVCHTGLSSSEFGHLSRIHTSDMVDNSIKDGRMA